MKNKYDPGIALSTANSFRQLSKVFTGKLGEDKDVAKEIAIRDIGGMIASPTVLSFSIELYLKGIISLLQPAVPDKHDLALLYKQLPQALRESVERIYNQIMQQAIPTHSAELVLELSLEDIPEMDLDEWHKMNPQKKLEYTIEAVLERNKDMFIIWRYMFEVEDDVVLYSYEYARLDAIAESLTLHLEDLIKQRNCKKASNPK